MQSDAVVYKNAAVEVEEAEYTDIRCEMRRNNTITQHTNTTPFTKGICEAGEMSGFVCELPRDRLEHMAEAIKCNWCGSGWRGRC